MNVLRICEVIKGFSEEITFWKRRRKKRREMSLKLEC